MITDQYINQLRDVFDENDVQLAYLFGSYAKGTESPLSDIDIAVFLRNPVSHSEAFDKAVLLTHKLIGVLHKNKVDVIILNTATPPIKFNAIKDRQIIYNRDEKQRVDFEVRTMNEYFDTLYLREEYKNSLFKNIEERKFYD